MSRRNRIVLTQERGKFVEGVLGALNLFPGSLALPGMALQEDPTQALQGGRFVWIPYSPGFSGQRPAGDIIILMEDMTQGITMNSGTSFVAGTRVMGWVPWPGCELNLLCKAISGTAAIQNYTAGSKLMPLSGDGRFEISNGSPQIEPAKTLEALGVIAVDTLAWCEWSGF